MRNWLVWHLSLVLGLKEGPSCLDPYEAPERAELSHVPVGVW